MHKIYAFIFAKGKSTRLKNKNLRKIGNKSMVEHSILIAKKIKGISKIFVSSESNKILNLAKKNNVNCIKRPMKLCSPNSKEIYSWHQIVIFISRSVLFGHIFKQFVYIFAWDERIAYE